MMPADTAPMSPLCEDCGLPGASIGDVVTGAELLSAVSERGGGEEFEAAPPGAAGECLVYMMVCDTCGWQALRSTERVKLAEDPEPIG